MAGAGGKPVRAELLGPIAQVAGTEPVGRSGGGNGTRDADSGCDAQVC
jgi:hypothetical protein